MSFAKTPVPPYWAVIFSSTLKGNDPEYEITAKKMVVLAQEQEGFLGIESAREDVGITVSYWRDLEAIKRWKQNTEHIIAQKMGREKWYARYFLRIAKVESDYNFGM